MITMQVIGNLGADAELHQSNGGEFISFRVAHSEVFNQGGQQVTRITWVDVTYNGNGGNLLQYLKRGAKVYVSGNPTFRVYSSAKERCYKCGVSIFARSIELCGGSTDIVPRELATTDGMLVPVNKWFHTPVQECWNTTLRDRSLNTFKVDSNGFITPQDTTSPSNQGTSGEQFDTAPATSEDAPADGKN